MDRARARCPSCDKLCSLRADGALRRHQTPPQYPGGQTILCSGSGWAARRCTCGRLRRYDLERRALRCHCESGKPDQVTQLVIDDRFPPEGSTIRVELLQPIDGKVCTASLSIVLNRRRRPVFVLDVPSFSGGHKTRSIVGDFRPAKNIEREQEK